MGPGAVYMNDPSQVELQGSGSIVASSPTAALPGIVLDDYAYRLVDLV